MTLIVEKEETNREGKAMEDPEVQQAEEEISPSMDVTKEIKMEPYEPETTSTAESPVKAPATTATAAPLAQLLSNLRLQFIVRSPKTVWIARKLDVKFSFTPTHCHVTSVNGRDGGASAKYDWPWQDVLGAHILTDDGVHLNTPISPEAVSTTRNYLLGMFVCTTKYSAHAPKATMRKRHLIECFYQFPGAKMKEVLELQRWITFLADPRSTDTLSGAKSLDEIEPVAYRTRKFLMVINPVGGSGKGVETYEYRVAPIFRFAGIETVVQLTKRASHGMEIIMNMPLNEYDCVVAVGGDGSFCELVQGLMKRPDWNQAIRQPLGVIPTGSGNGLASSVNHQGHEKAKPINSAFILAKGLPQDIDIATVRNGQNETMFSFLSMEYAMIADVDIESEKLRAMGGMRFTVTFGQHIFFMRREYHGTLWYLDDGEEDGGDDETKLQSDPPKYFDVHDPASTELPKLDLIESTDRSRWKEIKSSFYMMWAMNMTHAASDALVAPPAKFDDGYHYIMIMDACHPRKDLLAMLLQLETGKHIEKPYVKLIRTRAYKLQTENSEAIICIDGETFAGPYLETQVHRGLGCIITLPAERSLPPQHHHRESKGGS